MKNNNISPSIEGRKVQLTQEQEQAVKILDNAVVVAGAGSGKTTVLAMRVVQLMLSQKVPLSQILVLTFTKKASAEMQDRIHKQMLHAIETHSHIGILLSNEEVMFLEEQLFDHNVQISTIDSFCSRIATIAANKLGYVYGTPYSPSYDKELRDFVFQWISKQKKNSDAINTIASVMDIDVFISDYIVPILHTINTEDIDRFFDVDTIFQQCISRVQNMLDDLQKDIEEKIVYLNDVFKMVVKKEYHTSIKEKTDYFFSVYKIILHKEWSTIDLDFAITQLKKIDFRGKFGKLVPCKERELFKKCKFQLIEYTCLYEFLKNEVSMPSTYILFYKVIEQLARDWARYRKQNVLFSFTDIANIASKALEDYADIQEWFASAYRFIIVDEAQDNNFQQQTFLYNLSKRFQTEKNKKVFEPQKFYFVGDPQQSIYSFRGAEVQSFIDMEKEMSTTLYLQYNFRSSPLLIDFFNIVFDFLFNNQDMRLQKVFNPSQVRYQTQRTSIPSHCHNNASLVIDYPVELTLYRKEESKILTFNPIELEAYDVANKISDLCKKEKYAYEDIAILSRSKDVFPYVLKYLTILDIPHSISEADMGLRMDIGVDFYSWLSLLLYPEDRSAYAAVLRSPLANISDSLVLDLLIENNRLFKISQEMQRHEQYAQAVKNVHALHEKYNEAKKLLIGTAVDILDHFWLECGYRYTILPYPNYHSFLDVYYVLRSFLQQQQKLGGIVYVHTMLRNVLNINGNSVIRTVPLSDVNLQGSGVQIMTIHASKGLEFPVVFVVGLGRNIFPPLKHKAGVYEHQVIMRLPRDFSYMKSSSDVQVSMQNKKSMHKLLRKKADSQKNDDIMSTAFLLFDEDKQAGEALRMLYVAITRAKDRLFLSGEYSENTFFSKDILKCSTFLDYLQAVFVSLNSVENSSVDINLADYSKPYFIDAIHTSINNSMLSDVEDRAKKLLSGHSMHRKNMKYSIDNAIQDCTLVIPKKRVIELKASKSPYYTEQQDYGREFQLPQLPCEAILKKYKIYSDFGTYCHSLINEIISGRNKRPEQSKRKLAYVLSHLHDNERKLFVSTAEKFAHDFIESSFYTHLSNTAIKKTEYPFLLQNEKYNVWLKGSIDFLVYDEGKVYLIDFKVDSYRYPENHVLQISAYKLAVKFAVKRNGIFPTVPIVENSNIFCYLYYLRSAELVPIKQEIEEDALFCNALTDVEKNINDT